MADPYGYTPPADVFKVEYNLMAFDSQVQGGAIVWRWFVLRRAFRDNGTVDYAYAESTGNVYHATDPTSWSSIGASTHEGFEYSFPGGGFSASNCPATFTPVLPDPAGRTCLASKKFLRIPIASFRSQYSVLSRVTRSFRSRYEILGRVSRAFRSRYGVLEQATRSLRSRYSVIGRVVRAFRSQYYVGAFIPDPWDFTPLLDDRIVEYELHSEIPLGGGSFVLYSIRRRVDGGSWSTQQQFTSNTPAATVLARWAELDGDTLGPEFRFEDNGIGECISSAFAGSTDECRSKRYTRLVIRRFLSQYEIEQPTVTAAFRSAYAVVGRAVGEFRSRYAVTGRVTPSWRSRYSVLAPVTRAWRSRYAVVGRVTQALRSRYSVVGRAVAAFRSRYVIGTDSADYFPPASADTITYELHEFVSGGITFREVYRREDGGEWEEVYTQSAQALAYYNELVDDLYGDGFAFEDKGEVDCELPGSAAGDTCRQKEYRRAVIASFRSQYGVTGRVVPAFRSRYGVLTGVTRAFRSRYGILTQATAAFRSRYGVLGRVVPAFRSRYSVLGRVTASFRSRYSVAALVQVVAAFRSRYSVVGRATAAFRSRYSVVGRAVAAFRSQYTVGGFVTAAFRSRYLVGHEADSHGYFPLPAVYRIRYERQRRNGVWSTWRQENEGDWEQITDVRSLVPDQGFGQAFPADLYGDEWRFTNYGTSLGSPQAPGAPSGSLFFLREYRRAITVPFRSRYGVLGRATAPFRSQYAVTGRVTAAFRSQYAALGRVTAAFRSRYSIGALVAVEAAFRSQYSVLGRLVPAFRSRYSVVGRVERAFRSRYGITGRVTAPFRSQYGILGQATAAFRSRYGVLAQATASFRSRYGVLAGVTAAFRSQYAALGRVVAAFRSQYTLGNVATASFRSRYLIGIEPDSHGYYPAPDVHRIRYERQRRSGTWSTWRQEDEGEWVQITDVRSLVPDQGFGQAYPADLYGDGFRFTNYGTSLGSPQAPGAPAGSLFFLREYQRIDTAAFRSRYGVTGRITAPFRSQYSVLGRITAAFMSRYAVLAQVTASWRSRYVIGVLMAVTASFRSQYAVLGQATAAFRSRYAVVGRITAAFHGSYAVLGRATAAFRSRYGITGRAVGEFRSRYAVLAQATAAFRSQYGVVGRITAAFRSRYGVLAQTTAAFRSQYEVEAFLVISFRSAYEVAGTAVKSTRVRLAGGLGAARARLGASFITGRARKRW